MLGILCKSGDVGKAENWGSGVCRVEESPLTKPSTTSNKSLSLLVMFSFITTSSSITTSSWLASSE